MSRDPALAVLPFKTLWHPGEVAGRGQGQGQDRGQGPQCWHLSGLACLAKPGWMEERGEGVGRRGLGFIWGNRSMDASYIYSCMEKASVPIREKGEGTRNDNCPELKLGTES